jgi:ubiquinone/menaquinone biosynthesis C-methylase UbiE
MRMAIALRHRAGVEALGLTGSETVLEIGCGSGVATLLVAEALPAGQVVALDRSGQMIAQLLAGAAEAVAEGRIAARAEAFEDAALPEAGFDRVLAINVDFERRLGDRWPAMMARVLKPGGVLVLAFEAPPGSGNGAVFVAAAMQRLEAAGFAVERAVRVEGAVAVEVIRASAA